MSLKKNSRAREKISRREISRPEICVRTDVGIEVCANETRCLCSLLAVDARRFTSVASGDAVGVSLPLPPAPRPIHLVLPSVYLAPLI